MQNYTTTRCNMALPLPPGLTPAEVAFLCEMELVTIIPRQRLEGLAMLGVRFPHHPLHGLVCNRHNIYVYIYM